MQGGGQLVAGPAATTLGHLLAWARAAAVPVLLESEAAAALGNSGQAARRGQAPLLQQQQQRPCTTSAAGPSAAANCWQPQAASGAQQRQQQQLAQLAQRRRSGRGTSTSRPGDLRFLHSGGSGRSFASQPAFAYDDDVEEGHHGDVGGLGPHPFGLVLPRAPHAASGPGQPGAHDPHPGVMGLARVLEHTKALPCEVPPEVPPWDLLRSSRAQKTAQYQRELFAMDQWVWSGQHACIPFIGRSRFDPRTLHGPWIEPSVTQEELDQHVAELAVLPRAALSAEAAAEVAAQQGLTLAQLPHAFAAAPEPALEHEENGYPKTMFDDPADLARFANPDELLEPVGRPGTAAARRRRRLRRTTAELRAAAAKAAAAAEAEALAAAAAELASHAEQAERPVLPPPPGLPGQRKFVDLTGSVPAVLSALGSAGLEPDKGLETSLRRALKRVDPEAQILPRLTLSDTHRTKSVLPITPESAAAIAQFLLKDLGMSEKHVRRVVQRAPWVLGLDLEGQARPVAECLGHILEFSSEQIVRLVVAHPRTLASQVDEHLLPLVDYLQSLGFTPRHMRRVLLANPAFTENFSMGLLRTCVAFWLGKGMSRQDLVAFIAQYPKVTALSQTLVQLKFDWLKEHIDYGVADHARNPILLSRSLTDALGPRISYALHRGIKVNRPTDNTRKPPGKSGPGITTAKEITQLSLDLFIKRVKGDKEEFLAFREHWVREDLPRWLSTHQTGSLDYYHSLAWLQQHDTEGEQL